MFVVSFALDTTKISLEKKLQEQQRILFAKYGQIPCSSWVFWEVFPSYPITAMEISTSNGVLHLNFK